MVRRFPGGTWAGFSGQGAGPLVKSTWWTTAHSVPHTGWYQASMLFRGCSSGVLRCWILYGLYRKRALRCYVKDNKILLPFHNDWRCAGLVC